MIKIETGSDNREFLKFEDGTSLVFDQGKFDKWCVYFVDNAGSRKPPYDMNYFEQLKGLGKQYGAEKVYGDFVSVYDLTHQSINPNAVKKITEISKTYNDALEAEKLFATLHMTMIAEENRPLPLKKRVKRLGVHMILMENTSAFYAAEFSKGKHVPELDLVCKERGF